MRVQATKTMAAEINKHFKKDAKFNGYYAIFDKIYNYFEGEIDIIKIIYPDSFYAMPAELDNRELSRIYKNSDKTFDGFFNTLLETVEI